MRELAGSIKINKEQDITAMKMQSDGIVFAAGTSQGLLRMYDIRFSEHIFSKQHPYMVPIKSIAFNETSKKILSADTKTLRIYDQVNGDLFTTIEPNYDINQLVPYRDSGLVFFPCENQRVGIVFIFNKTRDLFYPSIGAGSKVVLVFG